MAEADQLHIAVSHSGRTEHLTLNYSATLSSLQQRLLELFDVSPSAQKLLLPKGRKLPLDAPDTPLHTLLPSGVESKLLLIGPTTASLSSLLSTESSRSAKHAAFLHHSAHRPAPVRNTTNAAELAEKEQWRFMEIRPFPPEVPCLEQRRKMLERLSEDRAVRDVMERHK